MKYAIGIFILFPAALSVVFILTAGGNMNMLLILLDAPSLIQFFFTIGMVLLITGEFKTFAAALNALFSKKYKITAENREKAIRLFELLPRIVNYTAVFYTIGVLILILGDIIDYEPVTIAAVIGILLLTPLYAAGINLVLILPATHILKSKE